MTERISQTQAIIIAAVIIVAGVGGVFLFTSMTAPPGPEPIKIGFISGLSPPGAYGAAANIKDGAELAIKHINEDGGLLGRPVTLVVGDSSGQVEKGIAAANRLITEDNVVAIVGMLHSSVVLSVQDICEEYEIPLLPSGAGNVMITQKNMSYTFRAHITDLDRADSWLNFSKYMGWEKLAIIAEDTDWGVGGIEWVENQQSDVYPGCTIESWVVSRESPDYYTELLEIKDWGPDVVLEIASQLFFYQITKNAYEVDLSTQVPLLAAAPEMPQQGAWEAVGEAGVGILETESYHPNMELTEQGERAQDGWYIEYGHGPEYFGLNGYSDVMCVAQAIEIAGSADSVQIANALRGNPLERWGSTITFEDTPGPYHQQASPPVLICQFTEFEQALEDTTIIFPESKATGDYTPPGDL
ncbi:MAG: ABC transporter substrate-binding protein [Candidatus Lokiarchaeota archaeon]|nr:ABC transporter substrate-binding protein [Candidatus Lokiarchaeota archaeon]